MCYCKQMLYRILGAFSFMCYCKQMLYRILGAFPFMCYCKQMHQFCTDESRIK